MLTGPSRTAIDRLQKVSGVGTISIDAYHQPGKITETPAGGSDNLDKACADSLATETAMRARFHDYRTRYNERYP
jgi:hypothetical protein